MLENVECWPQYPLLGMPRGLPARVNNAAFISQTAGVFLLVLIIKARL